MVHTSCAARPDRRARRDRRSGKRLPLLRGGWIDHRADLRNPVGGKAAFLGMLPHGRLRPGQCKRSRSCCRSRSCGATGSADPSRAERRTRFAKWPVIVRRQLADSRNFSLDHKLGHCFDLDFQIVPWGIEQAGFYRIRQSGWQQERMETPALRPRPCFGRILSLIGPHPGLTERHWRQP